MIIAWFSAGITSAVACRLALEEYKDVKIIYIHIDTAHEDSIRFVKDCEKWYGRKIEIVQSEKYSDQFEVIRKRRYINGVAGSPCTEELKKKVRQTIESQYIYKGQVFGFEFEKTQINRAIRFKEQYPDSKPLFPLIDKRLSKNECAGILAKAGIGIPAMYKLGFNNNNCVGCVKGGMWYWNKIREHFPETFDTMKELEGEIGASCINGTFLKDLKHGQGRKKDEVKFECGLFCEVEFADIIDAKVNKIMKKGVAK